jgi:hypothetical protein
MGRYRTTGKSSKSKKQSHVEEGMFITFLTFGDRVTDDSHANESMNGLIVSTQSNIVEGVTANPCFASL